MLRLGLTAVCLIVMYHAFVAIEEYGIRLEFTQVLAIIMTFFIGLTALAKTLTRG